ncbi:MAG: polymer-forming cytoskeletal protein [Gammaproteobacteria bacterium]|nr:polymer-forming cytoskeletal protein [Gammaproteobacteria bacterium]
MFSRDPRPERIDTLIGQSTSVHGDVTFHGGLHVDGRVVGAVRAAAPGAHLSVSGTGVIDGPVEAPTVVLHGRVRGDILARERLVLGPDARVEGNVYYRVIEMTLGAQIVGKLVRLEPEGADAEASGARA